MDAELKTIDYAGFVARFAKGMTFVEATLGLVAEYAEFQEALWPDAADVIDSSCSSDAAALELGDVLFYAYALAGIIGYGDTLDVPARTERYLVDADRVVTRNLGQLAAKARNVLSTLGTVEDFVARAKVLLADTMPSLAFLAKHGLAVEHDEICRRNVEKLSKRWPNGYPRKGA
jgi:NTP pyrophosphatase (non-canonical NTP hydrolase)